MAYPVLSSAISLVRTQPPTPGNVKRQVRFSEKHPAASGGSASRLTYVRRRLVGVVRRGWQHSTMNDFKATGPNLNGIPIGFRLRSRYVRKGIAHRPRAPYRNVSDTTTDLLYGMPRQFLVCRSSARAGLNVVDSSGRVIRARANRQRKAARGTAHPRNVFARSSMDSPDPNVDELDLCSPSVTRLQTQVKPFKLLGTPS